ncbi:MAG: metal ABC transporter ATP-binding protein [Pseudomonadota bacterium]
MTSIKNIALEIKNLDLTFEHNKILDNINLSVLKNDFLGIIGPNGGGKTTLLKSILGLYKPNSGTIRVFNKTPKEALLDIGYVPQISLLDNDFPISVCETCLLGAKKANFSFSYAQKDIERAENALKKVEVFDLKNKQLGKLSEGQKQRVFIARALAKNPKLLLLDEPTSSVDAHIRTEIYELLNNLKDSLTIIIVTHDMGVISSYIDKIACLNKKLYYHDSKTVLPEDFEKVYGCPFEMIAHGVPHRVVGDH